MGARITIRKNRLAGYARMAGSFSVPVLALAGLANRFDLMPFYAVLPAMIAGFLFAIGALVLAIFALMAIWQKGGHGAGSAVAGVIYALPALLLAAMAVFAIFAYPRVADVTTDAGDPPKFLVLPPHSASMDRAGADGAGKGGPPVEIVGIAARLYPVGIDPVYAAITGIVAKRGWRVAQNIAPTGESRTARIEAMVTTLLFAFKDDVAIRLFETGDGTRVDMRSASRWGRHDLGQNGRRIRAFMGDLDLALQGLFTEFEEPVEEHVDEPDEGVSEGPGEEPANGPAGGET